MAFKPENFSTNLFLVVPKNFVLSANAVCKYLWLKMLRPFIFGLPCIVAKISSKSMINK